MASIRNRQNKWQARIKRHSIVVEKSFLTKRDAERWARQTEAEIERGDYTPPAPPGVSNDPATLHNLLERYENEVAGLHRSPTTSAPQPAFMFVGY